VAPIVLFVGVGVWTLWETGRLFWVWWVLPICWGLAWLLIRWWQTDLVPVVEIEGEAPRHWTPQDEEAARIVQARQEAVREIDPEKLTDPHFYFQTALDLSLEIARHYHPKARDPLTSLTVPEILAAAQLAVEDVSEWVHDYVPGSHLLTVKQWRMLSNAPDWYRTASNVTWAVAVLVNPWNIGRYFTSKYTIEPLARQMQANILAKFYVVFIRHVGFYLIEMNSGRLRGGAERYREVMQKLDGRSGVRQRAKEKSAPPTEAETGGGAVKPTERVEVTVALVGQVKAGKSSLVNALLGEQQAATDVLPLTKHVQRFRLELPDSPDRLVLLDTAGYSQDGATTTQVAETRVAFRQADLVLLVMNVTSPARDADRRMIEELRNWYKANVRLKPPPVVGVLTHIDGLSPMMEWSPPYDWNEPKRPKERNIREAVEYNRGEFGDLLAGVVPVCTDHERNRVYGIDEWLLPAMAAVLSDARACSLIRNLHAELDRGKVNRLLRQLRNAGVGLLKLMPTREKAGHSQGQ
jgi:uncharacterized protein